MNFIEIQKGFFFEIIKGLIKSILLVIEGEVNIYNFVKRDYPSNKKKNRRVVIDFR